MGDRRVIVRPVAEGEIVVEIIGEHPVDEKRDAVARSIRDMLGGVLETSDQPGAEHSRLCRVKSDLPLQEVVDLLELAG